MRRFFLKAILPIYVVSPLLANQCEIVSPLPVPVTLTGCTYSGTLPSNSTSYIQNTLTPTTTTQAESVEYSSVTAQQSLGYISGTQCLHEVNGQTLGTGSDCGSGGGGGGAATLPLPPGDTNYVQISTSAIPQAGAFDISSGTVSTSLNLTYLTPSQFTATDSNKMLVSRSVADSDVPLISSGVAFGSAVNVVTQDTNTFLFNDTAFALNIGTNPYNTAGYSETNPSINIWNAGSALQPVLNLWDLKGVSTLPIHSVLDTVLNDAPPAHLFTVSHGLNGGVDKVTFLAGNPAGAAGNFVFGGQGGQVYLSVNSGATIAKNPITVQGQEVIQGSATIGGALGANVAYETQAGSLTVTSTLVKIDGVMMNFPSSGTIGNYLQYTSTNTLQWVPAASSGGGGDNLGSHIATMTVTANYGLVGSTASFTSTVISTVAFTVYNTVQKPILRVDNTILASTDTIFNVTASTSAMWGLGVATDTITGPWLLHVSSAGHIDSDGGPQPVPSSCGATPSASMTASSTDRHGTINVGGGVVTSCVLTFATAWTNTPDCVTSDNSGTVTSGVTSVSKTAITITTSATLGGGTITYHCED